MTWRKTSVNRRARVGSPLGFAFYTALRSSMVIDMMNDFFDRQAELAARREVASDCIASYDQEHHAVTTRYLDGKMARFLGNSDIMELLACL